MNLAVDIVKRGNKRRSEAFDCAKLRRSIMATCHSLKTPEGQSHMIADAVCSHVIDWLENRPEVTSDDLRLVAARHLKIHHPEAAYIYEQHHMII